MIRRLQHAISDRSGNMALFGSLLSVPLVLSAGVVVDLTNINRVKTELQQSIDAAALSVAREGEKVSDSQARAIAMAFMSGNLPPADTKVTIHRQGGSVRLAAETRASLAFGGLFGYDNVPIVAAASAEAAFATYEVALVLDTTGSMAGGKLVSMKDAVLGLIDTMSMQLPDSDKLKFSLVPFANFVNVGPQHAPRFDAKGKMIKGSGADWLDLRGRSKVPQQELVPGLSRFALYHNLGIEWAGCVETRMPTKKHAYDVDAVPASPKDLDSLFVPAFHIDEPDSGGYANSYIASAPTRWTSRPAARRRNCANMGPPTP